jgi:hypothetical protein
VAAQHHSNPVDVLAALNSALLLDSSIGSRYCPISVGANLADSRLVELLAPDLDDPLNGAVLGAPAGAADAEVGQRQALLVKANRMRFRCCDAASLSRTGEVGGVDRRDLGVAAEGVPHVQPHVVEESVLRYRTANPEDMAGQLRHLLAVMPLVSVSLGIIPFTAQRTLWPLEAVYLHDDVQAVVETLTAEINVRQPRELSDYARAFTRLSQMAVHGDAARALIHAAIDALE